MSKRFYVINAGRSVYAPGFYEENDADTYAQKAARSHPGRTYTVMRKETSYLFDRNASRKDEKHD